MKMAEHNMGPYDPMPSSNRKFNRRITYKSVSNVLLFNISAVGDNIRMNILNTTTQQHVLQHRNNNNGNITINN
jgi:hypothetical protein